MRFALRRVSFASVSVIGVVVIGPVVSIVPVSISEVVAAERYAPAPPRPGPTIRNPSSHGQGHYPSRPDPYRRDTGVGDVITLIDTFSRLIPPPPPPTYPTPTYPQRPQPVYYPPQPVVTPVTTMPTNVVTAQPVQVPTNKLPPPQAVVPSNSTFASLSSGGKRGLGLTDQQANESIAKLDDALQQDAEDFGNQNSSSETTLDILMSNTTSPPLTAAQKDRVDKALSDNDPVALKEAMLEATGGNAVAADAAMKAQVAKNAKDEYLGAVKNGVSADELSVLGDRYFAAETSASNALLAASPGVNPAVLQKNLDADSKRVNDMLAKKTAAETIEALQNGLLAPGGGSFPLPGGSIVGVWLPGLLPGQYVATDSSVIFTGTGTGGVTACGYVSPAEVGLPVVEGEQVPNALAGSSSAGQVVVENPAENDAPISMLINNEVVTLAPGQKRQFAGSSVGLMFDKGGSFGRAKYTLGPGLYRYSLTNSGWDVHSQPTEIVLDNRANPYGFSYVINNKVESIEARDMKVIATTPTCEIRFDPGNGREVRKNLEEGTYSVAVDTRAGVLDLFSGPSTPDESRDQEGANESVLAASQEIGELFNATGNQRRSIRQVSGIQSLAKPMAFQPPARLAKAAARKPPAPALVK